MSRHEGERPWVVMVHGLVSNRAALLPLAYRLSRRGFRTRTFGYRSIRAGGVRDHAAELDQFLQRFESQTSGAEYHLVVHSMGGILVRALLERRRPEKLKRIVMLGTPNTGSHAARRLAPWLGAICQPLHELSDAADSLVQSLGGVDGYECGVIAGTRDRVVSVSATHLGGTLDHHTVRSGHGELLFRLDVAIAVASFLKTGVFTAAKSPSVPAATTSEPSPTLS